MAARRAKISPVLVSVGLATAQGSAAEILAGCDPLPPLPLPWPADQRTASTLCRPARDLDPGLAGAERWHALARRALIECCGGGVAPGTPLLIASCNGAADSFAAEGWKQSFDAVGTLDVGPWASTAVPVVSAACASGLHALFLARRLLEAGAEEVVVLAVDILSAASHRNFEALRILSGALEGPWQSATEGFFVGEAAVGLRLRRSGPGPRLLGPVLGHDLGGADGLGQVLHHLAPQDIELIVGQGTGPADVDTVELAALEQALPDLTIPLTTPLYHFGHTLAGSGLLSLALAALARQRPLAGLVLPQEHASDGRRLVHRPMNRAQRSLVVCRALGGACAAVGLGWAANELPRAAPEAWAEPVEPGPIHHPLLRQLAVEALAHRPAEPPHMLVLRLSEPLRPPPRAVLGGRLLPSAVLEITPGAAALLVARAWGYAGPTLCLVGPHGVTRQQDPLGLALANPGLPSERVHVIYLSPEELHIDWN